MFHTELVFFLFERQINDAITPATLGLQEEDVTEFDPHSF